MSVNSYQKQLQLSMGRIFNDEDTKVKKEYETNIGNSCYSPRLDLAVGPYAEGSERYTERYDTLCSKYKSILDLMVDFSNANNDRFPYTNTRFRNDLFNQTNYNSRCFIGIEIENQVSQKHLLGGAINATSMGRIGVLIAWNTAVLDKAFKMRRYLMFLKDVEKAKTYPDNLLILLPDQFESLFNSQESA